MYGRWQITMQRNVKLQLSRVGENIAIKRKQAGMSQTDLALKYGMDRQNLSNIERGKKNIQALTICRLANAFGIEAKELLDFE